MNYSFSLLHCVVEISKNRTYGSTFFSMFLYLATDRASSAVSAERRLVSYWHTPLFESPRLQIMASPGEIQLQAGLYKTIIRTGNGTSLQINDKVTVHCTGFINSDPPTKFWR